MNESLENISNSEVVDYVVSSLETISQLKEANRQLEEQVVSLQSEKVELEKVASQRKEASTSFKFDEECIEKAASSLESIAFFDKEASADFRDLVVNDPNQVFNFIQKIAFAATQSESMGDLVTSNLSSDEDNNSYGDWSFLRSSQN
jgi:DNA repair ATPase RecN